MDHISPEKLAWMAGIIDMKGAIVRKRNPTRATPQLCLMVESPQLGIVDELCRLTGIGFEPREIPYPAKWMQRGCLEHCPEPHVEHTNEAQTVSRQGRWLLTGAAAAVVLYNVIPYMLTDQGLSDLLAELLGQVNLAGRSGNSARQAVARLAGLGFALPPKIRKQYRELVAA